MDRERMKGTLLLSAYDKLLFFCILVQIRYGTYIPTAYVLNSSYPFGYLLGFIYAVGEPAFILP